MKPSIVIYSWTGNTAACAVALQEILGCDASLLEEEKPREGNRGFALGGTQASLGLKTQLKALPDISDADPLLLGMPLWAATTPPAINTFFKNCDLSGKKVYCFATQQSEGVPQKLETKLRKKIAKAGGTFMHLFVLRVPHGKQLSVEEAKSRAEKWAERIKTGT